MEWLILLIVVPAIVVPVVLLYGFAGCGFPNPPIEDPVPPNNLHALLAPGRKTVNLNWTGVQEGFELTRDDKAGSVEAFLTSKKNSHEDTSSLLKPGVTYFYTAKGVIGGQPQDPKSNDAWVTIPPAPPILSGQFESPNLIKLKWTKSEHADKYRLQHRLDPNVNYDPNPLYEGPDLKFDHQNVQTGTHTYRVIAVKDDEAYNDSTSLKPQGGLLSDPSNEHPVPAWTQIFPAPGTTLPAANPASGVAAAGQCIVQRIPAPTQGGNLVKITLSGIAGQATNLTAITISKAVPVDAPQAQNSADQPVEVKFGGASGANFSNGVPLTSDPLNYAVTVGQELHVAFNVSPGSQNIVRRNVNGRRAYTKTNAAANEAKLEVRPGTYNTNNNVLYCIEKIEVA
jgi:hypothetical protein